MTVLKLQVELRRLRSWALVGATLVALACIVSDIEQDSPAITPADLANHLGKDAIGEDFRTSIRISTSSLEVIDHPTLGGTGERVEEIESVFVGARLWQEATLTSTGSPDGSLTRSQLTYGFDGEVAYRESASASGFSLFDKCPIGDMASHAFIFNRVAARYPSNFDLSEFVRSADEFIQQVDDGVQRFEFVRSDAPNVVFTIEAQLVPEFRLLRVCNEIRGENGSVSRNDFRIIEWQTFRGVALPKRARLESTAFGRSGYEDKWIRTVSTYERINIGPVPDDFDSGTFSVSYEQGTPVYDSRLNLSFVVGDRDLYYDGVSYRVAEPILNHPGDRLDEVLRAAEGPSRSKQAFASEPVPRRSYLRAGIIALGVATGTALLLLGAGVLLRIWRQK